MTETLARTNYNRLQGIISIVTDMQLHLKKELDSQEEPTLMDNLYMASLGDIAALAKTLSARTPWAPTPPRLGEQIYRDEY